MKHIKHDALIVEHLTGDGLTEEYIVESGVHFSLVFFGSVVHDMNITPLVRLHGAGAHAQILGALYGSGKGIAHITTLQHHEAPNTTSNLLVKSVMTQESTCNYEGSIKVDVRAQKTDAYQRNENLLIGKHARAVSSPALEILANDVRCTHGAVVKTLDASELWYAATRGIGKESANALITGGFLASVMDAVADIRVREDLYAAVAKLII